MSQVANQAQMRVVALESTTPKRISRSTKRLLKRVVLLALPLLLVPQVLAVYVVCGLLDVARNRQPNVALFQRYFLGNGVLTWLLSPFNLLMDLLTLPYWNRGVYQLADLPASYQAEIQSLINSTHQSDLVERLRESVAGHQRTMMFFKWYGKNIETAVDVPAFHQRYKYIRTIGVSVFSKQQSTSEHFGPLRVTLRMLYSINPIQNRNAYIQVGDHVNHWCDNRLFIFDDTLQHQSCNQTEEIRYCMFVDILRPSPMPGLMSAILNGLRLLLMRCNFLFYKHWKCIK